MRWHRDGFLRAVLLVGVSAWAAPAAGQISPGPLAHAHRSLDGSLDCFKCHVAPGRKSTMDANCLACHTEIATMRSANRGYHAKVADQACASCHPDHAGRDFDLVSWGKAGLEAFDHNEAGWPLEGKHAKVECRTCHEPKYQRLPLSGKLRVENHTESWLALETDCVSCHKDVHRSQVGSKCETCHGLDGWSPAAKFDHDQSRFALTGKHVDVECAKCHPPAGVQVVAAEGQRTRTRTAASGMAAAHAPKLTEDARYRPVPHAECSSCHRDVHQGRFGTACSDCHSTKGFAVINEKGFDHDLTRYPLKGKHAEVACADCHDTKRAWGAKPPFATCGSCHKDQHAGQGQIVGKPADCATCHTVATFEHSSFTVASHRATRYPLEGAHVETECRLCHARGNAAEAATLGPARVRMRPGHEKCVDCHRDPHAGRFATARGAQEACLSCHDVHRFRPSAVDVAAHAAYAFPLEGAHAAVPCQACHAELKATAAASTLRAAHGRTLPFTQKRARCTECHEDVHAGQFKGRKDRGACEGCHDNDAFAPASRFDHNRHSSFKLEGEHARTPCLSCHRTEQTAKGPLVIWRPVPHECESCHGKNVPEEKKSGMMLRSPRREFALMLTTREASAHDSAH